MRVARNRLVLVAIPLSLTALLLILAVLQYRWVGELSANERRRMNAALRANANAVARDVDGETAAAALVIHLETGDLVGSDAAPIVERWERWAATAPTADLIAQIFVVTIREGAPELRRVDRATHAFVDMPWPLELAALRRAIEADMRNASPAPRRWIVGDMPPAIIARVGDVTVFTTTNRNVDVNELMRRIRGDQPPRLRGYAVAVLDPDAFRERLLPSVVRRYLTDSDYRIGVLRRTDRAVIWRSGPGSLERPDVTAGLLALGPPPLTLPQLGAGVSEKSAIRSTARVVSVANVPAAAAPLWDLVAVHREGSVDAAVSRTRVRNLAVGSSILLILAAGMWLVLLYARRAEALARQQLEFVSAMSHELRTPVAVVSTAAENLRRGVIDSRERGREYGEVLGREANRLSSMIEQVLEFARSRSAHSYARVPLDLRDAVRDAVDATSALARDGGGVMDVSLPEEPVMIAGDRAALSRATQNLITNALKYGGNEPRIRVELTRGRAACIVVSDHGPGIPAHERGRVLEPFFRGRLAIDAQIAGSGLGLALVQRIALAHGGRVTIESGESAGTSVTIVVPV